jgi:hypothetical protein
LDENLPWQYFWALIDTHGHRFDPWGPIANPKEPLEQQPQYQALRAYALRRRATLVCLKENDNTYITETNYGKNGGNNLYILRVTNFVASLSKMIKWIN